MRIRFALLLCLAGVIGSGALSPAAWAVASGNLARNLQFDSFTAADGLSAEFVTDIAQDGRGYLWFSTQMGLNRYNGYDIVIYEHDAGAANSLSNNFARSLYVDPTGELWITTDGGVDRYDYREDRFVANPLNLPDRLASLAVRTLIRDAAGRFWLGTVDAGLIAVDADGRNLTHHQADGSRAALPHDHIIAVFQDRRKRLWVGTDGGGLARWDPGMNGFFVYRHNPANPTSISSDSIRVIYEDRAGNIWIGTSDGGLNLLDETNGGFRRFQHDPEEANSLAQGQVFTILEDNKGTLWVGTESGLSEWRMALQGFVNYRHNPGEADSLADNSVTQLFQDQSGVLWVATNGGVSSWNYFSDAFSYHQTTNGVLNSNVVTALAEDQDGFLWIGTYQGGLTRLDLTNNEVRHYRHSIDDPASLAEDRVMAVHVDHQNRLWVGTRASGLNRLEADGSFTRFAHEPAAANSLSGNGITRIHADPDGTVWVGVFDGGLNRLAPDGTITHFRHNPDDERSLSSNRVLAIHRDRAGALWIGAERGGLNRLEADGTTFTRFRLDDQEGAHGVTAWDIAESADGALWISTMDHGLLRWRASFRQEGLARFDRFGRSEGLSSAVYSALPGDNGEVWASSSRGLFRFDPREISARRYDQRTGLKSTEFMPGARLRNASGRLLFGSNKGMVSFFPIELTRNTRPPQVHVYATSRDRRLDQSSNGMPPPTIVLPYADPFITFEFMALDYVSSDKNRYRYRLAGFDNDWVEAGSYRRAPYTNLPSGEYQFQVQGANNDGVWNRQSALMNVVVTPPVWRQWWAYLAYVLAALLLFAWLLYAQQRKRRAEVQARVRLEEEVAERTRELASRYAELESLNERLSEASVTDSLTGLRNRRFVDDFIEEEIALVERRLIEGTRQGDDRRSSGDSSQLVVFMMIDLDGFKAVNDTHGHHAGDEVLLQVRDLLVSSCRASDVIVRWGGDEFMIIAHPSSMYGAKVLAEKVRRALVEHEYRLEAGAIAHLSASIGVAPYPFASRPREGMNWEQVTSIADRAAYLAKENGKNAWVSLNGTTAFSQADFPRIADDLAGLQDEGKVALDSSVGNHLVLDQRLPVSATR